ncbi:electron transport complex protein RnfB [Candidatus Vesicomyidisocius calyptogenae]|uniref:Ion-translocating oxidoreductase complex subunit B n=1 Tax=Vesicomyosocius okutanii subsp. Calyptogena okutanii (strain HA) TaxID=412965 RepID=A5CXQ2_VESOH|nr:electron transport complex protein RnfB [Candidatus Vesicomyosocius okutanii]
MSLFDSVLIFSVFTLILGLILGYAGVKFKLKDNPLVNQIDTILPQIQCGQCDYPGCRPYACAIASGEAKINQCPPGGQEVADALAELLGVETLELNAEHGETKPSHVVFVDEQACIGCTLCIQACPVDAFVGASKMMTQVIINECTGCDLCIPVCPVDCIYVKEITPNLITFVSDIIKVKH